MFMYGNSPPLYIQNPTRNETHLRSTARPQLSKANAPTKQRSIEIVSGHWIHKQHW
jgi:hypothetical protein